MLPNSNEWPWRGKIGQLPLLSPGKAKHAKIILVESTASSWVRLRSQKSFFTFGQMSSVFERWKHPEHLDGTLWLEVDSVEKWVGDKSYFGRGI